MKINSFAKAKDQGLAKNANRALEMLALVNIDNKGKSFAAHSSVQ